ncbi:MAG: DUF167 domain-containing protein [Spirochaetes bacterium]|nr:DUF167 domain-containing protein [Spirochaetota bacterium]
MILHIKVVPNAKKDRIGEKTGDYLKIFISAPPVDNKGNIHLINFLSKKYKAKKSMITIVRGERSHYKTVKIEGI